MLVERAVVVVLAVLAGDRRAGLVEEAREVGVAPKLDAWAARGMLREVGVGKV
jgi:hypothetical protein